MGQRAIFFLNEVDTSKNLFWLLDLNCLSIIDLHMG